MFNSTHRSSKITGYTVSNFFVHELLLTDTEISDCTIQSFLCDVLRIQDVKFVNCKLQALKWYPFREINNIDFDKKTDITGLLISKSQAIQEDIHFENADFNYIYVGGNKQSNKYTKDAFLKKYRPRAVNETPIEATMD